MIGVFDHPWLGGLFGDEVTAAIWAPERQIGHMLAFEAAFTRALGHAGQIPQDVAEAVAGKIDGFRPDPKGLRNGMARDGVPVPALVAQLKPLAGDTPKAVHAGATSQDVVDTALALVLADFNPLMLERLKGLAMAIDDLSARFGGNVLLARTRMQAALPITVADRLRTWSGPMRDYVAHLERIRPQVERLQLGGAVGDRAALKPDTELIAADMADRLGLGNPPEAWQSTRGALAEYAGLLSGISGALGKMGQDVCLMAQQGIDAYELTGGGGSSAMPHKQNPVLAELLVTLARFNATQVAGIHHALIHEQERSGSAWALEWMILPQMAQTTSRSLAAAAELCRQTSRIGQANRQAPQAKVADRP